MRFLLALAALCLSTLSVQAQDWRLDTTFEAGWFWGAVNSEYSEMFIGCSGYHPGADMMVGSEDGPHHPYVFTIELPDALIPAEQHHWANAATRNDVMIVSNGLGYILSDLRYNELNGARWETYISVGDPLIVSLLQGGPVDIYRGEQRIYALPGDGIASAVTGAMQFCDAHWMATGTPMPAHAVEMINRIRVASNAPDVAESGQPMLDRMLADITTHCGGPGEVQADTIDYSDFDGDGIEDVVLDWRGVSCQGGSLTGGQGAGNCGFANCLIEVYVSGAINSGAAPWGILAVSGFADEAQPTDILMDVTPQVCTQLGLPQGCLIRRRWNGVEFIRVAF